MAHVSLSAHHDGQDALHPLAGARRQGPLDEGRQLLPGGAVSEREGEYDGRRPLPAHGVHMAILADLQSSYDHADNHDEKDLTALSPASQKWSLNVASWFIPGLGVSKQGQ